MFWNLYIVVEHVWPVLLISWNNTKAFVVEFVTDRLYSVINETASSYNQPEQIYSVFFSSDELSSPTNKLFDCLFWRYLLEFFLIESKTAGLPAALNFDMIELIGELRDYSNHI